PPIELLDEYNSIITGEADKRFDRVSGVNLTSNLNSNNEEDEGAEVITEESSNAPLLNSSGSMTVTGNISDTDGLPLPTATVSIKGTTMGTTTDFDGNYSINVNPGQILQYSFVGYASLETTVGASNTINITMESDDELEEVVVTAQGIKRENKAFGYAVTTLSADDLRPGGDTRASYYSSTPRRERNKESKKKLFVSKRKVNEPYMIGIVEEKDIKKAYKIYLTRRELNKEQLTYYIDMYDVFKGKDIVLAERILSNITELDPDNYELLRAYAYKLEETGDFELAEFMFKKILKLRSEDSQSYRDLALTYEAQGKYDEAETLLASIVDGSIYQDHPERRRFEGLEIISKNELVSLQNKLKKQTKGKTYDVRIIIDWNHNDTDIDLHVIDPNREKCYYGNRKTAIGGKMSRDMTQGFGPEEYTLKKAKAGEYYVKVNYFGDRYQKISNPTFMKVTIFKYYGTDKEQKEIKVVRLDRTYKNEMLAKLVF
ncbi:MAG: carboxypeptidase-like regulatory domain-containing protein, partial [Flavobacteriaceae bacterium]|nr:carboxypeptidase-like regulatory domain-containing protein [Flavobacteriaceae bacterium]